MGTYTQLPVTVSDIEDLPEDGKRYEVIEGELHVSTAPGFPHQMVLGNLHFELTSYLRQEAIGRVLWGIGIVFDEFNGVVPDLLYISNERLSRIEAGGRLIAAPETVIEVISPGKANERRDRVVKRDLFARTGVSEYWIIDPTTRSMEIYRKKKTGGFNRPVTLAPDDELTSSLLPDFRASVGRLFE